MQYLIAYTSDVSKLVGGDWVTNGAGLRVSPQFGFGAINAEAMVNRARYWTPVEDVQVYNKVLITRSDIYTLHQSYSMVRLTRWMEKIDEWMDGWMDGWMDE